MKTSSALGLLLVAGMVAVGCQASPDGSEPANDTEEPAAPDPGAEPAGQAERRERAQPQAPRAEGVQLAEFLEGADVLLLDVRRPQELESRGTVEGYLNIPIEELADRLEEVPRDRPILTA